MMQRIKSGIDGLDEALEGLPTGKTCLLTGDAGSGKTIFGLQFANQCCVNGLKTVYLSTEEIPRDLKLQASSFGWDFEGHEKKGLLTFVEMLGPRMSELESAMSISLEAKKGNFEGLLEAIPEGTQVLVIDSLGSHTAKLTPREFKDRMDLLVYQLNKREITTMLILDSATSKEYNNLALFSVYGAIVLKKRENPYTGRRERVMDVVKMRNTKTPLQLLTFNIGAGGLLISTSDEGYNQ
jgi:KaiC/GvpD/RAD55 family RecA-like ATPase